MKANTLPLHKNPAWVNMEHYASFGEALDAMRYYEERYERWMSLRSRAKRFAVNLFIRS